jgi:hypothetical protein
MLSSLLSQFAAHCNSNSLLGLPTWNKYLNFIDDSVSGACTLDGAFEATDIWLIAAAILEILVRVAGVVAVFFIIYGGFKYMTSFGNPDKTTLARKTIINAVAGLAVAIVATTSINFIANTLANGNDSTFCTQTTTVEINPDDEDDTRTADICTEGTELDESGGGVLIRSLNVIYAISGTIAAMIIVLGGLKYTTSSGDPQKINSSRNTIIYAIVWLLIILLAAAITNFVITGL